MPTFYKNIIDNISGQVQSLPDNLALSVAWDRTCMDIKFIGTDFEKYECSKQIGKHIKIITLYIKIKQMLHVQS